MDKQLVAQKLKKILLMELTVNSTKKKLIKTKKRILKTLILQERTKQQNIMQALAFYNFENELKLWKKPRSSDFFETKLFNNGDKFFKENIRMHISTFEELCLMLRPVLDKKDTHLRETIQLKKRVAIALYFLGSSGSYESVSNMFGVGRTTVCQMVLEFCHAVWNSFKKIHMNDFHPLNSYVINRNINGFEKMGFPQCIGAIDSFHIRVNPSKVKDTTDFYNGNGFHSIILFAVVDFRHNFMYINVDFPGKFNDSTIFEASSLNSHLSSNTLLLKHKKIIKSIEVPPLLIGDAAFKLNSYVMKPYPDTTEASKSEKLFNSRLSKCRKVVNDAFAHLTARFQKIGKGIDNRIENVPIIVKAGCVLHNFLNSKKDDIPENWLNDAEDQESDFDNFKSDFVTLNSTTGISIRNAISLNFIDEAQSTDDG